jgi:hypothetical protein
MALKMYQTKYSKLALGKRCSDHHPRGEVDMDFMKRVKFSNYYECKRADSYLKKKKKRDTALLNAFSLLFSLFVIYPCLCKPSPLAKNAATVEMNANAADAPKDHLSP